MFEDLKKSTRGGAAPGTRKSLLGVSDPRMRLYLMIGAAVVLGAIALGLHQYAGDPENKKIDPGEPAVDPGLPIDERFSGVPPLDPKFRQKIEDDTPKARRRWQNDVMSYLLYEAGNTPAVLAYKKNLFPLTRETAQGIAQGSAKPNEPAGKGSGGSASWRYQYVWFRGVLETGIEEINYESVFGKAELPVGQVHRARVVLDGEGPAASVLFYTPMPPYWADPNTPEPFAPNMMIKKGWIRGRGIFVKRFVDTRGGQDAPCLLVVATHIERDYEHVDVKTLADIPFGLIQDDWSLKETRKGLAQLGREFPRPLFRLVQYASKRAGEAGRARREAEGLKPKSLRDPKVFEKVITQPARHRADYFGGLGAIGWPPNLFTADPNDAAVEEYVTGYLVTDSQKLIQFVAPVALGAEWKRRDRIRWEGFFYKTRHYKTIANKDKIVPMIVLTRLEIVTPVPPDKTMPLVIAGLFVLGLGALAFLVLREDRTKQSFRRQARRRSTAAISTGSSPNTPENPSDPSPGSSAR